MKALTGWFIGVFNPVLDLEIRQEELRVHEQELRLDLLRAEKDAIEQELIYNQHNATQELSNKQDIEVQKIRIEHTKIKQADELAHKKLNAEIDTVRRAEKKMQDAADAEQSKREFFRIKLIWNMDWHFASSKEPKTFFTTIYLEESETGRRLNIPKDPKLDRSQIDTALNERVEYTNMIVPWIDESLTTQEVLELSKGDIVAPGGISAKYKAHLCSNG